MITDANLVQGLSPCFLGFDLHFSYSLAVRCHLVSDGIQKRLIFLFRDTCKVRSPRANLLSFGHPHSFSLCRTFTAESLLHARVANALRALSGRLSGQIRRFQESWLGRCLEDQSTCRTSTGDDRLPTRRVDLDRTCGLEPRLCKTKHLRLPIEYVTMGPRWGKYRTPTLSTRNVDEWKHEVDSC